MNVVFLLFALKKECEKAVKGLKLKTAVQKGDIETLKREPEVHLMRLPNSAEAKKKAPYIIIQYVNGEQQLTEPPKAYRTGVVRFIFCVYDDNEEEGALELLDVMEAVKMRLLKLIKIGDCFTLDREQKFEDLVYPDDTAPYYAGELIGTFHLPSIEQEVNYFEEKNR